MDKMLYIALSGANQTIGRQNAVANNIANVNTPGFRAQLHHAIATQLGYEGTEIRSARAYAFENSIESRHTHGPIVVTDNPLDVAIHGDGFFAIQSEDGGEAYTRNGKFTINENGVITDASGRPIVGDGGLITIPLNTTPFIGKDGLVLANGVQVGQLKRVLPENMAFMKRGDDGLFRYKPENGEIQPLENNPAVNVVSGAHEGSNVNMTEEMANMISLQRQFDMQMKFIKTAEENDRVAAQLLSNR